MYSREIHDTYSKSVFGCVFCFYSFLCIEHTIKLFLELFNALPPGLQRSMLLNAAESVKDTLHQCRLLLLVVDRYPAQVEEQGVISGCIIALIIFIQCRGCWKCLCHIFGFGGSRVVLISCCSLSGNCLMF